MFCCMVLMGLPGSGKSRVASELRNRDTFSLLSSDDIREKMFGVKFDDEIKDTVTYELIKLTNDLIIKGNNVLIDSTFFNEVSARTSLLSRLNAFSEEIRKIAVIISADIETCIQRDSCRNDSRRVGRNVIISLLDKFTMPSSSEGWDFVHVVSEQCDIEELIAIADLNSCH